MIKSRVSSLNVRSIRSVYRRAAIFKLFTALPCDILCLQECILSEEPKVAGWTQGPAVWSLNNRKSGGVCVLFKSNSFKIKRVVHVDRGRCVLIFF